MSNAIKVAGVGDNTVDIYIDSKEGFPGGNCVNFSVFAQRLGVEASYIGVLGKDENGKILSQALQNEGVNLQRIRFNEKENAYTFVRHEKNDRVFIKSDPSTSQSLKIEKEDLDFLNDYDLIHSSIYSKIEIYLSDLNNLGCKISYDFSNKFSPQIIDEVLPWVDYAFFSWSGREEKDIIKFLRKWTSLHGTELVITNGSNGSYALVNGDLIHVPAEKIKPLDTMGGGDAYISNYLICRLQEKQIETSMKEATKFAAESCLHKGSFGYKHVYQKIPGLK
ncbi:hypothetical protein GM661_12770 [Iocasia frigidifontis]|uniref:Carbohydrate kinase PfkB domain-containing protein n=1 Tax=Iocasia fonsfrigidae TaxID=2682810 RepID=A0A8A7KAH9_9FIRM|nr:PfkB family carbohydrate kinase [Iocasia fonsfrigidae]QTL98776.1 hypothetical protein GM661_12770 [Iocasia fonsfrigidae]